jgi:CRP-like cAMP-binding protein
MKHTEKYDFLCSVMKYIHVDMDKDSIDYFIKGTTDKTCKKNELIISTENIHNVIYFIAKGLVRGYYIDDKGNEINTRFVSEGGFATHYSAFVRRMPSNYNFMTVEPCEFICFDYFHIQDCLNKFHQFERFGRLMAEAIIGKLDSRMESQQFDNASKRYADFMKEYPGLNNRLSLEHISSYLRVTRPALSRIRAKKL